MKVIGDAVHQYGYPFPCIGITREFCNTFIGKIIGYTWTGDNLSLEYESHKKDNKTAFIIQKRQKTIVMNYEQIL